MTSLGQQLHDANVSRALLIAEGLPRSKDGLPKYSRNKELAKWQAAAYCLAEVVRAQRRGGE